MRSYHWRCHACVCQVSSQSKKKCIILLGWLVTHFLDCLGSIALVVCYFDFFPIGLALSGFHLSCASVVVPVRHMVPLLQQAVRLVHLLSIPPFTVACPFLSCGLSLSCVPWVGLPFPVPIGGLRPVPLHGAHLYSDPPMALLVAVLSWVCY